jgi:hypothetical protein
MYCFRQVLLAFRSSELYHPLLTDFSVKCSFIVAKKNFETPIFYGLSISTWFRVSDGYWLWRWRRRHGQIYDHVNSALRHV